MACAQLDGPCSATSYLRRSQWQRDLTDLTKIWNSTDVCIIAEYDGRVQAARVAGRGGDAVPRKNRRVRA